MTRRLALAFAFAAGVARSCAPSPAFADGFRPTTFTGTLGAGLCLQFRNADGTNGSKWCANGTDGAAAYTAAGGFEFGVSSTGAVTASSSFQSNAGSGSDAFKAAINGARFHVGAGANDYFDSTGSAITAHSAFNAPDFTANSGETTVAGTVSRNNNGPLSLVSRGVVDAAASWLMTIGNYTTTLTPAHDRGGFQIQRGGSNVTHSFPSDGTIISATPYTVQSLYYNALVGAQNLSGHLLAQATTVTSVSILAKGAVSAGAGNTVIRVSDGTNNCDATFSCTADTNTNGVKNKAPTGTCAFATGATLTYSIQTANCATTQATVGGITWEGKLQ